MTIQFAVRDTEIIRGRPGIQHFGHTKHGLFCSIVCHSFSYGHEEGLFELGILVPDRCYVSVEGRRRYTLPPDVNGWLTLEEAKMICERFANYPIQKMTQAFRYFRKAQCCKSRPKAQKFQRKANWLLAQLPPVPSIYLE